MTTENFLQSVLGGDGHYCIFAYNSDTNKRLQQFFSDIPAALHAANLADIQGYETYFALGTFTDNKSRKAPNVKNLKAFFLDLDCGPSKEYATQQDAFTAVNEFCLAMKLPRPTLVNSGRGLHVYWPLTDTVAPSDWLPVAEQLKRMCTSHGLLADPVVTADVARVLRIPDTHNHKTDPPTPVKVLGHLAPAVDFDKFAELFGQPPIDFPVISNEVRAMFTGEVGEDPVRERLMGNNIDKFSNLMKKIKAGKGCAQMEYIIREQATMYEPLWKAGLSICGRCVDSEKAAQFISRKHPGYSPEATLIKMQAQDKPHTCGFFDDNNTEVSCDGCPHKGKITSPVQLCTEVSSAEDEPVKPPAESSTTSPFRPITDDDDEPSTNSAIPKFPKPYFRGKNGGVYVRSRDEDGNAEDKLIYRHDLYVVKRILDKESGESVMVRLHLPKDGVREFTMPLTAVTSRDEFRRTMSMHGIASMNMAELMKYIIDWVANMQELDMAEEAHRQFGWAHEYKSFILGNQELRGHGVRYNPPSTPTLGLMHLFKPKGTLEGWKEVAEFYNRPQFEMYQYVMGCSFGSPLMEFLPENCAGFHMYDKNGGKGKTSALKAAASIWGNPEELILGEKDTANARENRGEIYKNLILPVDELTNTAPKACSEFAYNVVSGKQKNRMKSSTNVERERGDPWHLICVSTGNTSLIERIAIFKDTPRAEAQRILEYRVEYIHFNTKAETDKFSRDLLANYGHAGTVYMQYVIRNRKKVVKMMQRVQAKIDSIVGLKAENRYWSAQVAASLTGLMIAKKLGLVNYDIDVLTQWAIKVLRDSLHRISDMTKTAQDHLIDYYHENYNNCLQIKSTADCRGKDGSEQLAIPEATPRFQYVMRYEVDTKTLSVLPKPLRRWCGEQQIDYQGMISDLMDKMGAKRKKVRMGKGTKMQFPPTDAIVIQFTDAILDNMSDEQDKRA